MFQTDALAVQQNKARAEKWAYLTEGISDPYTKTVTEVLLENEEKALMTFVEHQGFSSPAASYAGATSTSMADGTATGNANNPNIAPFYTFAFPIIRRVFPGSIMNELVSVQPMSQPAAKIFFLDFQYGEGSLATQRVDAHTGGDLMSFEAHKKFREYSVAGDPYLSPEPSDGVNQSTGVSRTECDTRFLPDGSSHNPYGEGELPKQINWQMSSDIVEALTRKLRAVWTIEAQQDLKALHGLDAEAELTTVMSEEIRREIEGDVIYDMLRTAGTYMTWSVTPSGTPDYVNQKAYARKLYEAVLDLANAIYKKRYTYPTWIIADPDTCTRLEKLEDFKITQDSLADGRSFNVGRTYFGTIGNKFKIYKDPWLPVNTGSGHLGKMLMGFRGASWFQTGYVYAPYVPLLITPVMMDPNDFMPRRGMMTRYGKKSVIPDMYAVLDLIP